ncbi:MAG TPA: superoxide dismutase [Deltaproteobacteria bacterium]|nr:superoxide dismutase [Deltaproteobacteria bacterium]HQI01550.1 superoxide dismutase [Deltaproteobacteria bacterium]HQJ08001.1 superoxide dismutase [Deltaproteobacteria bacterium]
MMIELPKLPYPENALEPTISARTLEFHHGKHHKAYVDTTNKLISGTDLENASVEDIIKKAAADPSKTTLFNNSAQVWNHDFYWKCLKPGGGGAPSGNIASKINSTWGSADKFFEELKNAGATQFGSGWAWLVLDNGELKITKTPNADNPLTHGQKALLTIDVWEHAYYLDYQNRRADYLSGVIEKLINWDFVNANFG